MAPFLPNEYLFKTHADKGKEKWEIFAWAVRDVMVKNCELGKIESGYLERANVDITSEMVTMLKTQQAFSGVSRLLQTEIDISKRLINS